MPPLIPPDATQIALVLLLSFLIGLEREERKKAEGAWMFGGVRTFPLIGLASYAMALLSGADLLAWTLGFAVVGGFMLLSYNRKLAASEQAGITTEMSGLVTYLVAGLVYRQLYWIAATIAVLCVLLLELKKGLEGLTKHVASGEIATVAQFLVLTVVILPIVPDRPFTSFAINPFRTWLVVVAVSGVSFGSYVLQRMLKGRGGIMLSALLGGAYSSTVATVVLARRSRDHRRPNLFAGSILAASGVMYVRLLILIAFFNLTLARMLLPGFALGALAGVGGGWYVSRRADGAADSGAPEQPSLNPLELQAAFLFAAAFVAILVVTTLVRQYLGRTGLYSLAAMMGVTDVDPFILGLTQANATAISLPVAATAIIIAASSNNVVKAVYARSFGDRVTGRRSLLLLLGLAVVGLAGLAWI
ncbi:MAG TPA: MgtC/SapB family protein [Gemmatimonadaceae bacterium]|nr:MgtC/SapB family protein [Gemmatimonadaceae bacterium]